jgi:hypothetical protein
MHAHISLKQTQSADSAAKNRGTFKFYSVDESHTFAGVPAPSYIVILKSVWLIAPVAEDIISNNHIVCGCCSSQIFLVNESVGTPPQVQPNLFVSSPGSGCSDVDAHLDAGNVSPVDRVLSGQASAVVHTAKRLVFENTA